MASKASGVYTMTMAVIETLDSLPKNTNFSFNDFLTHCRTLMQMNGNFNKPFDGTIQRAMRKYRASYGLVCVDSRKSIYRLEDKTEK